MMLIFCMQITMKSCYKLILGIWLGWSSILKVPKIASSQCPYKFSKKKLDLKLIFACKQTSKFLTSWFQSLCIKVSYKGILSLLMGMITSILKVLQVTRLQYLYNISKRKSGMKFIFSMQINIKVWPPINSVALTCSGCPLQLYLLRMMFSF